MRLLLALLLALPLAAALQVSPAIMTYDEATIQTSEFTLRGSGTVDISYEGALAQYAQGPMSATLDGTRTISVVTTPPEDLESGVHELLVIFRTAPSEGQVGVATELAPTIRYEIPYEGAYLEAAIAVQGKKATLVLENKGVQDTIATPTIAIEDQNKTYEPIPVPARTAQKRVYELEAQKGSRALTATINSPEQTLTIDKEVAIGAPEYEIVSTSTRGGDILAIDLALESDWNKALTKTITASINDTTLEPQTTQVPGVATLFWEGSASGTHELEVTIDDQQLTTTITKAEETIIQRQSQTTILAALIAALALLAFILYKKRR